MCLTISAHSYRVVPVPGHMCQGTGRGSMSDWFDDRNRNDFRTRNSLRNLTIEISEVMYKAVDEMAKGYNMTKTAFVKWLIEEHIELIRVTVKTKRAVKKLP